MAVGRRVSKGMRTGGRAGRHRALAVRQRRACVDVLQRASSCVGLPQARMRPADMRDADRSERAV